MFGWKIKCLQIQEDAKKNIAATKTRFSFEEFLASYEKQAERMKGDIENLEDYLTKYGFQKQKGTGPFPPPSEGSGYPVGGDGRYPRGDNSDIQGGRLYKSIQTGAIQRGLWSNPLIGGVHILNEWQVINAWMNENTCNIFSTEKLPEVQVDLLEKTDEHSESRYLKHVNFFSTSKL